MAKLTYKEYQKKRREAAANRPEYYDTTWLNNSGKMLLFSLSNRLGGKSTAWKAAACNSFLLDGSKMILLLRYDLHVAEYCKVPPFNFVNSLYREQWGGTFSVGKNRTIQFESDDGEIFDAGYVMALSTAERKKTLDFSDVKWVIFDEFLGIDTRFLPFETEKLLTLIDTISRGGTTPDKIRREEVRCVCISNLVSAENIYWDYFGITIPPQKAFKLTGKGWALDCQYFDRVSVGADNFDELIADTQYGNFAQQNKVYISKRLEILQNIDGWELMGYISIIHTPGFIKEYFTLRIVRFDTYVKFAIKWEDSIPEEQIPKVKENADHAALCQRYIKGTAAANFYYFTHFDKELTDKYKDDFIRGRSFK